MRQLPGSLFRRTLGGGEELPPLQAAQLHIETGNMRLGPHRIPPAQRHVHPRPGHQRSPFHGPARAPFRAVEPHLQQQLPLRGKAQRQDPPRRIELARILWPDARDRRTRAGIQAPPLGSQCEAGHAGCRRQPFRASAFARRRSTPREHRLPRVQPQPLEIRLPHPGTHHHKIADDEWVVAQQAVPRLGHTKPPRSCRILRRCAAGERHLPHRPPGHVHVVRRRPIAAGCPSKRGPACLRRKPRPGRGLRQPRFQQLHVPPLPAP